MNGITRLVILTFLKKHSDYISGLIHLINEKVDDAGNETLAPARFFGLAIQRK